MRGLSEYRIRAADSISPPLALEGAAGSVFWMLAPWNLWGGWLGGGRALWILDSGNWAVGGSTGVGARPRTLDSGFWKLGCRRVEGCGPARAFWILDSGSWGFDMGFESGGAARILHSAFCILQATYACFAYAWGQGCHMSGCWILDSGNWAVGGTRGVGRPDSVFCILYSAGRIYAWAATTRVPGVCVCVIQQPLYHLCGRE